MRYTPLIFLLMSHSSAVNYDEDINLAFSSASNIYHSPFNEPCLKYLTTINNCTCRGKEDKMAVCTGNNCRDFPSTFIPIAPIFKLKLSAIKIIKKNDFVSLSEIESLEIEGNSKLEQIEPGCFENMTNLHNLTLFLNTNLKYLEENVFDGLKNVKTIRLPKNGFRRVIDATRALSAKYVPAISNLDLTENILHSVQEDDFHPMNGTTLKELSMHLCEIDFIHSRSLDPLKNLTTLRLGQNMFNVSVITNLITRLVELETPLDLLNLFDIGLRRHIPLDLLTAVGQSNVTDIVLGGNHFSYIDDESFPNMSQLVTLDLRGCLIEDISPNAFKKIPFLMLLHLGENRLTSVPAAATIETLLKLDLGGNTNGDQTSSYFYLQPRVFQNMSKLETLQLPYNNIGSIYNDTFVGLTNLNKLNLKNTSLSYIEPGSFVHLKNLVRLNLVNNMFTTEMLTADTFKGLHRLNVLLLDGCSIQNLTVTPSLFTYTDNLTYLGLGNNKLRTISPNQISHLSNLKRLNIAENKLTPWNKQIFPNSEMLVLIANQNKFTYITTAMLNDWKRIQNIYLDGNPLTCDCSLYNVVTWLDRNKISLLQNDSDEVIANCVAPINWQQKTIESFIDHLMQNTNECETFIQMYGMIIIVLSIICLLLIIILCVLCYLYRWYIKYWIFLLRLSVRKHNIWYLKKSKLPDSCISYKYDAFVSYSKENRNFVLNLVATLENNEPYLKLCIYERDFQIGAVISATILESVATSKRTLLIISNAFAKSEWCRWETQLAEYHQLFFQNDNDNIPDDTLIMIKIENVCKDFLTPTLKYLMKTRIYLEWDGDKNKQKLFWDKLRATLAAPKGIAIH